MGFFVEPQVLPGACCGTDFPWENNLPQASTCSVAGLFHDFTQGAGESLLQNLHIPSPSFPTDLMSADCFPHIFPLLSSLLSHSSPLLLHKFLPFKYIVIGALLPLLIVSALAETGSVLEPMTLALALLNMGEASSSFSQKPLL